jgi:RNA-binding protein
MARPLRLGQTAPMLSLSKREVRQLKARAQTLKALLKVGRQGLSAEFCQALDEALAHHELLKVKFDEFKERKRELAPQMAEKSRSLLVTLVGNVAVLYRPKPPGLESPNPKPQYPENPHSPISQLPPRTSGLDA